MIESFQKFKNEGCNLSETFQYWDRFIALVAILRNLVKADHEGDWNLPLHTVQCILPFFALFDCLNYLQCCSLYLEDMRHLPETAPGIHQAFLQSQFVAKRTPRKFRAVVADQSLEQTISHRRVVVVSLVVRGRKTLLLNGR